MKIYTSARPVRSFSFSISNICPRVRRRARANNETRKAKHFMLFPASFLSLCRLFLFPFLRLYQPSFPRRLCFFSTVLSVHYDLHARINSNFKLHPCALSTCRHSATITRYVRAEKGKRRGKVPLCKIYRVLSPLCDIKYKLLSRH